MVQEPEYWFEVKKHLCFLIEHYPNITFKDAICRGIKAFHAEKTATASISSEEKPVAICDFFFVPEESANKKMRATLNDEIPWAYINVAYLSILHSVKGIVYGPNDEEHVVSGLIQTLNSNNPLAAPANDIYKLHYPNAKNGARFGKELHIIPFTQSEFFGAQLTKYEHQGKDYYSLVNNHNYPLIFFASLNLDKNLVRAFGGGSNGTTSFSSESKSASSAPQETFGVTPIMSASRQEEIVSALQSLPHNEITQLFTEKMYIVAKGGNPCIHFPPGIMNKLINNASDDSCMQYQLPTLKNINFDIFDSPNNQFAKYFGALNDWDYCEKWRSLAGNKLISDMTKDIMKSLENDCVPLGSISAKLESSSFDLFRSFRVCIFVFFILLFFVIFNFFVFRII